MSKLSENFRKGMTQYFQQGGAVGFRAKPQTPEIPQDITSPPQNEVPSPETAPPAPSSSSLFSWDSNKDVEDQPFYTPGQSVVPQDEDPNNPGTQWYDVGEKGQGGYQTTGSSWDTTAGNFNIQGGNKFGYEPGARGKAYMSLKGYSQAGPQVKLGGFKFGLLPYQGIAGAAADAIAPDSPFEYGESESGADWSGGATGGNVATNKHGTKVSVGYGYGQVDPAIAKASGYTTGQGASQPQEENNTPSNAVTTRSGSAVTDRHGNAVTFGQPQQEESSSDSGGGGK